MDAKTVEKQEARNPGGIEFFSFEADVTETVRSLSEEKKKGEEEGRKKEGKRGKKNWSRPNGIKVP